MKTFTAATAVEPPGTSNRRQPLRQTRMNPSRSATRPLVGRGSLSGPVDNGGNANPAHGFFPAITHFTDSITALPKEMIRHYTMLKEIDAKIYGPEDALKQLVSTALNTPVPQRRNPTIRADTKAEPSITAGKSNDSILNDSESQRNLPHGEAALQAEKQGLIDSADLPRRNLFLQLRIVMSEMLMTLDEKNHVMSTATEALDRQLARCDSSYPHIESEISEEARYGNLHHWAYMEKTSEKKGTTAGERTRRDAAGAAAVASALHEEVAAVRSEARREAMAARKQHNKHIDSDFDEGRGAGHTGTKKSTGTAKGRKVAEPININNMATPGLGIINGPTGPGMNGPNKRRKLDKQGPVNGNGGLPMEKSLSAVYGSNAGNSRVRASSPRDTLVAEARKTKGRGGAATNGSGRRRANTNTSAINSPSLTSSPVVNSFAAAARVGNSPIPTTAQRTQSSRVRKNSTQSVVQDASRNRPTSSASNKPVTGNGLHGTSVDMNRVTGINGKINEDSKNLTKESTLGGDKPSEEAGNGENDQRGDLSIPKRASEKSVKREENENGAGRSRMDRPPSISTSTRGGGKASKTATPVSGSFPEQQRPRSGRSTEVTIKRSHKKGAGLAAQLAAQAAAAEEEGSSFHGDEEEEEDESELRYCYCNGVSYGDMVACDNADCKREWFHLECAGLTKAPSKNTKWYCRDCKESMRKGSLPGSR